MSDEQGLRILEFDLFYYSNEPIVDLSIKQCTKVFQTSRQHYKCLSKTANVTKQRDNHEIYEVKTRAHLIADLSRGFENGQQTEEIGPLRFFARREKCDEH